MEIGVEQEDGENKEIREKGNKGIRQGVGRSRSPSERSASPYSLIPLFPFSLFLLLGLAFAIGVIISRGFAREVLVRAATATSDNAAVVLTAQQSAVEEASTVGEKFASLTAAEEPEAINRQRQPEAGAAPACRFAGIARIKLGPAPAGTRVAAWVEGIKVAETRVVVEGGRSTYTLTLDGRYAGKTVEFRFPEYPQFPPAGYAVCQPGQEQVLSLEGRTLGGCGGGG